MAALASVGTGRGIRECMETRLVNVRIYLGDRSEPPSAACSHCAGAESGGRRVQLMPRQVHAQNAAEAQPQVISVQGCSLRVGGGGGHRVPARQQQCGHGEGTGQPHSRKTTASLRKEGRAGHLGEVGHDICLLMLETPKLKMEERERSCWAEPLWGRGQGQGVQRCCVSGPGAQGPSPSPTGAVPCPHRMEELYCHLLCPGGAVLASPIAMG